MELTVVNTSGIPESGIISIRAGSTRRQAQISALDRPLKFPTSPEECTTFKVDVLALLASGRLAYVPEEQTYSLVLDPPATEVAAPTGPVEVGFQVSTAGTRRGSPGPTEGRGSPEPPFRGASPGPTEASGDETEFAQKREESARAYLEKHGLTKFMQFLMQSLMKDKPADPYTFLHKQITQRMVMDMARSPGDQKIDALLTQLPEFPSAEISADQLAALEKEAELAAEQLRADNARLRAAAAQLRTKYGQLQEEGAMIQGEQLPVDGDVDPHVKVYTEIAMMQDEISALAIDNQKLVEDICSMKLDGGTSITRDLGMDTAATQAFL
jgi:hypothetical protein